MVRFQYEVIKITTQHLLNECINWAIQIYLIPRHTYKTSCVFVSNGKYLVFIWPQFIPWNICANAFVAWNLIEYSVYMPQQTKISFHNNHFILYIQFTVRILLYDMFILLPMGVYSSKSFYAFDFRLFQWCQFLCMLYLSMKCIKRFFFFNHTKHFIRVMAKYFDF